MLTKQGLPDYDHLIIIGNGFDINLGLKTSYNDFLKSKEFASTIEDGKNNLCLSLKQTHYLQNWIDVENEIKNLAKRYRATAVKQLKKEVGILKKALSDYLTFALKDFELDKSSRAYSFMEGLSLDDSLIINFNYTDVFHRYMEDKSARNSDKRVQFIHGNHEDNNIIIGVEDGTEMVDRHEFLLKSTHVNYTGFNLNRLLHGVKKLTVFGHSLGESDEMYFTDFFNHYSGDKEFPYFKFDLYYYDEDSYDSLMSRINVLTNQQVSKFRQNLNFTAISSFNES